MEKQRIAMVIGVIGLLFMLCGLAAAIERSGNGIGSGDAASWMQAIGAVAAIFGTFYITRYQYERVRVDARDSQLSNLRVVLEHANQLVKAAPNTVDNCTVIRIAGGTNPVTRMEEIGFADDSTGERYKAMRRALQNYPYTSLQDSNALEAVFKMEVAIAGLCNIFDSAATAAIDREKRIVLLMQANDDGKFDRCLMTANEAMEFLNKALKTAKLI